MIFLASVSSGFLYWRLRAKLKNRDHVLTVQVSASQPLVLRIFVNLYNVLLCECAEIDLLQ